MLIMVSLWLCLWSQGYCPPFQRTSYIGVKDNNYPQPLPPLQQTSQSLRAAAEATKKDREVAIWGSTENHAVLCVRLLACSQSKQFSTPLLEWVMKLIIFIGGGEEEGSSSSIKVPSMLLKFSIRELLSLAFIRAPRVLSPTPYMHMHMYVCSWLSGKIKLQCSGDCPDLMYVGHR